MKGEKERDFGNKIFNLILLVFLFFVFVFFSFSLWH